MIVEGLASFAIWILNLIFEGFTLISLPANFISFLITILEFGAWVVGGAFLSLVFSNIFFWLSFKLAAGLVLFIYRLIPLT